MEATPPKHTVDMETNKSDDVDHVDIASTEKGGSRHDSDNASINADALGDNLPPGYFYSMGFIGSLLVSQGAITYHKLSNMK